MQPSLLSCCAQGQGAGTAPKQSEPWVGGQSHLQGSRGRDGVGKGVLRPGGQQRSLQHSHGSLLAGRASPAVLTCSVVIGTCLWGGERGKLVVRERRDTVRAKPSTLLGLAGGAGSLGMDAAGGIYWESWGALRVHSWQLTFGL